MDILDNGHYQDGNCAGPEDDHNSWVDDTDGGKAVAECHMVKAAEARYGRSDS